MIMNGVEVDIPSTTNETYIPNMSVDENVVSSEEVGMVDSGVAGTKDMATEVKTEEDVEKLKEQLLRQLEYYFSSENLTRDQYLVSQMDDQKYVPIWTIANFNLVKNLTTDIDLITEVLKSSSLVQVDDKNEKVRPNQTMFTTFAVILREIAAETPIESIQELFHRDDCPDFLSCEFAGNSNWYVTFENEADAKAAYIHLRENVKTFNGKPIMARMKSKTHHMLPYFGGSKGPKPPTSEMAGPILSPPYISSPMNVFSNAQPGAPFGPGGQPAPFIAALPSQPPPGSTSPHNVPVSTSVPPQPQLYVMPHNGQPWYSEQIFGNQSFAQNAVFSTIQTHIPPPNYNPGKRGQLYPGPAGRGVHQDGRVVQLQQVNPSGPEQRPHYLPAVSRMNMPVGNQQNVYATTMIPGPYYKNQHPNRHNRQNGVSRYSNNRNNSYYPEEISPRLRKVGASHTRYSARHQQHDYTNRLNSDSAVTHHNGPPNMQDSYANHHFSRNNSTGHDAGAMNGNRFGHRQGFNKFQDPGDGQGGQYNMNDINNNAAKRPNFNDTVPNVAYERSGNNSMRQRRNRKNGDSRSSSARPSPPCSAVNGPDHPEETFNLENTAFPPLPGTAASNVGTNPIPSTTDVTLKKPQVPEESYKNSLKMNLDRVVVPVQVAATANLQPSNANTNPPVAKEQTMQSEHKEATPKSEPVVEPPVSKPTPVPAKPSQKAVKSSDPPKPTTTTTTSGETRNNEKEKVVKSGQKQSKVKSEAAQKGKSEPTNPNTSEKSTVPTAESDAGKKLSYAEMLRKKSAKPVSTSGNTEVESKTDLKSESGEENPKTVTPTNAPPRSSEAPVPVENGEIHAEDKSTPSPTEGSEDGDDKAWESAGPTKRSHRNDRGASNDHSHHNGYEQRDGYQRSNRNGGYSGRSGGNRNRGRGRGGYGRGGGRYNNSNFNGRDKLGANGDRQTLGNGEGVQRKR